MAHRSSSASEHSTFSLGDVAKKMAQDIYRQAKPKEQAQMDAARRRVLVFRAWNHVAQHTREGRHVTGLHYLPEDNVLVVYADAAAWAQELFMMREIIRARMAHYGVHISSIQVKTSRPGYVRPKTWASKPTNSQQKAPVLTTPLTQKEEKQLDQALSVVSDKRLREALKKAEKAHLEWKKSQKP
ncbi:DUF721 domain-containing protein [Collinsella sp. AGMB00827]|uniref:DUF721 domain-containing protein n=1 Tax=Collinsella ureilytica TaxID=2869515 RepID=A0ABS7MKK1_9ACTN|nr:DciA family protein [Collinsella urealyticum]MBY4797797.1 DUF721 domain-containing protein [Collinsella urealyticum]